MPTPGPPRSSQPTQSPKCTRAPRLLWTSTRDLKVSTQLRSRATSRQQHTGTGAPAGPCVARRPGPGRWEHSPGGPVPSVVQAPRVPCLSASVRKGPCPCHPGTVPVYLPKLAPRLPAVKGAPAFSFDFRPRTQLGRSSASGHPRVFQQGRELAQLQSGSQGMPRCRYHDQQMATSRGRRGGQSHRQGRPLRTQPQLTCVPAPAPHASLFPAETQESHNFASTGCSRTTLHSSSPGSLNH